jgi:RimJ/RimL family protein N-acetyltransferase
MAILEPTIFKMKDGRQGILRSLEVSDAAEILSVARTVFEKCGQYTLTELHEFTYTVEQEEDIIRKYLEHPDKIMIAPEVDGLLVGMLNFSNGARKRNSHQGEFGVSALPEFHGLGLGRIMVENLLKWAATTPNVETVRLRVHEKNVGAHALYLKLGFIEEGREIRGVRLAPGMYDNVISMAYDLKRI